MVDIINAHPQLHHVETAVRLEVLKLSEVCQISSVATLNISYCNCD